MSVINQPNNFLKKDIELIKTIYRCSIRDLNNGNSVRNAIDTIYFKFQQPLSTYSAITVDVWQYGLLWNTELIIVTWYMILCDHNYNIFLIIYKDSNNQIMAQIYIIGMLFCSRSSIYIHRVCLYILI